MVLLGSIVGQHGDFKAIKHSNADLLRSVEYVMKENNYVSHGVDPKDLVSRLKDLTKANSGVWSAAASRLQDGWEMGDGTTGRSRPLEESNACFFED